MCRRGALKIQDILITQVHLEEAHVVLRSIYDYNTAGIVSLCFRVDLATAHPWAGVGRPWGRPRSPWAGRLMGRPARGQRRAPMGRPSTAHLRTTFPKRMDKSLVQRIKYRLFTHVMVHTVLDIQNEASYI